LCSRLRMSCSAAASEDSGVAASVSRSSSIMGVGVVLLSR
jgi:hypothetical protein